MNWILDIDIRVWATLIFIIMFPVCIIFFNYCDSKQKLIPVCCIVVLICCTTVLLSSLIFANYTEMNEKYFDSLTKQYTSKYEKEVLYNMVYDMSSKNFKGGTIGFMLCNQSKYESDTCKSYLAFFEKKDIIDTAKKKEAKYLQELQDEQDIKRNIEQLQRLDKKEAD